MGAVSPYTAIATPTSRPPKTGVKRVCKPTVGKLSAEQRAEQHQRWFRRGQRVRAGCEGRISVMKRRDGLTRCRYRGMDGMERWVGWAVVSNNLWVLMRAKRSPRKSPSKPSVTPSTKQRFLAQMGGGG
ncbi:MAG: transposase [Stellaceae bacterium]